jgi:hypothetical protein
MTDRAEDLDIMYYQLVLSMQAATMQHLGKVMSPVTGKVERNLDAARYSIDMLEMLQRKTVGNLSPDERKLLDHVLHELRLNYLDETTKVAEANQSAPKGEPSEAASNDKSEQTGNDPAQGEGNPGV